MRLYNFIASMTTGLVLLAIIGIVSAIASSFWSDAFFRTMPFRFLLLLLFVNIALCTINTLDRFLQRRLQISKHWRLLLRSISLLMLHAGIVFILIGAGLYSFLGHTAQLSILEGDKVEINKVIATDKSFSLKLNKFTIAFNDDGSPSQYYSDLEVSEPGKAPLKKIISVNYPLNYAGIKAYQSSYGYLSDVLVEDGDGEAKITRARDGDFIQFASTKRMVKIVKYIPHFDQKLGLKTKSAEPLNPRVVYSVYEKGTELMGVGAASFGERIKIDENVFINFEKVSAFSVLTVKSDPGLPLAAAGGLLFMLGVCIVLFGPGRQKEVLMKI